MPTEACCYTAEMCHGEAGVDSDSLGVRRSLRGFGIYLVFSTCVHFIHPPVVGRAVYYPIPFD